MKKTMFYIDPEWDLNASRLVFETEGDALEYLQNNWLSELGPLEKALQSNLIEILPIEVYTSKQSKKVKVILDLDEEGTFINQKYPNLRGDYIEFKVEGPSEKIKEKIIDIIDNLEFHPYYDDLDTIKSLSEYIQKTLNTFKNKIQDNNFNFLEGGNIFFEISEIQDKDSDLYTFRV